jgi:K+/H+ antiporter YhaU regulatory subunit KhtT
MNLVYSAPRNPDGRIPIHTNWYKLDSEPLFGKTIGELEVRRLTGCTIWSVRRGGVIASQPDRDFILVKDDELQVFGTNEQLYFFERVFAISVSAPNVRNSGSAIASFKRVA